MLRFMRGCLLFLVACGAPSDGASASDAPTADVRGFDLLISSTYVLVYPQFIANASGAGIPALDTCGALETDTASVFASSLRDVSIDGLTLSNDNPYPGMQVSSPYTSFPGVTVETVFRATDADISIEVPLHAQGYPTATAVQAQQQGTGVLVSWSAPTADSVLVGSGGGFGFYTCHRPPSSQFLLSTAGQQVEVQPISAAELTMTALGSVRVFYGEIASVTVPTD